VTGACPACVTPLGWVDLSHDGVLHGRSSARGGPYFTIHCPACSEPLEASGGEGRVFRFRTIRARASSGPVWWRRWFDLLFGAEVVNNTRNPRKRRGDRTPPPPPRDRPRHADARLARLLTALDLPPTATLPDVKKRFRDLAKQTHPDTLGAVPAGEAEAAMRRFIRVNQAYREILEAWPERR